MTERRWHYADDPYIVNDMRAPASMADWRLYLWMAVAVGGFGLALVIGWDLARL